MANHRQGQQGNHLPAVLGHLQRVPGTSTSLTLTNDTARQAPFFPLYGLGGRVLDRSWLFQGHTRTWTPFSSAAEASRLCGSDFNLLLWIPGKLILSQQDPTHQEQCSKLRAARSTALDTSVTSSLCLETLLLRIYCLMLNNIECTLMTQSFGGQNQLIIRKITTQTCSHSSVSREEKHRFTLSLTLPVHINSY